MNWRILLVMPLVLFSFDVAKAGSAPGHLTCKSESGKVELKGDIPASEESLDLTLLYNGTALRFGFGDANADVAENLRKGAFKLSVQSKRGNALELRAIPGTVVRLRIPGSDKDFDFDAMLIGPRPGGPFDKDGRSVKPLKATLKCRYHYSI